MTLLIQIILAVAFLGLAALCAAGVIRDETDGPVVAFGAIGVLLFGLAGIGLLVAVPIIEWTRNIDEGKCHRFGEQANFETKQVEYNYWSWECLVHIDDRWVQRDNLRFALTDEITYVED